MVNIFCATVLICRRAFELAEAGPGDCSCGSRNGAAAPCLRRATITGDLVRAASAPALRRLGNDCVPIANRCASIKQALQEIEHGSRGVGEKGRRQQKKRSQPALRQAPWQVGDHDVDGHRLFGRRPAQHELALTPSIRMRSGKVPRARSGSSLGPARRGAAAPSRIRVNHRRGDALTASPRL